MVKYEFASEIYRWNAQDAWHFVSLPLDISQEIREVSSILRRGFGSVRVKVTCGSSIWSTSVFPDSNLGCFVLPLKAQTRKEQGLKAGDTASFQIELVDF
ncbi:MAG: hypothetical protein RL556_705 [Actinomycetota bacterium]